MATTQLKKIKQKRIKHKDRLQVKTTLSLPDFNKGLSYTSTGRKLHIVIDGEDCGTFDMNSTPKLNLTARLRVKIEATNFFEKEDGSRVVDLKQTHIIGQNFIDVEFPKSGKIRRKYLSFHEVNEIQLLCPQDFWDQR